MSSLPSTAIVSSWRATDLPEPGHPALLSPHLIDQSTPDSLTMVGWKVHVVCPHCHRIHTHYVAHNEIDLAAKAGLDMSAHLPCLCMPGTSLPVVLTCSEMTRACTFVEQFPVHSTSPPS